MLYSQQGCKIKLTHQTSGILGTSLKLETLDNSICATPLINSGDVNINHINELISARRDIANGYSIESSMPKLAKIRSGLKVDTEISKMLFPKSAQVYGCIQDDEEYSTEVLDYSIDGNAEI